MKLSKKNNALFYTNGSKGIFLNKFLKSPLEISFPKDVISHMEVVDPGKLDKLITEVLESKKIPPSKIFIILGEDTTFEKDLTDIPKPERYQQIQKFADLVPFEKTQNKIFKVQKKEKVIVANRDFSQKLVDTFNKNGFFVEAVLAKSLFPENFSKKGEIDSTLVLKKIDSLKNYNLLESFVSQKSSSDSEAFLEKYRLIILSTIFALLIIALAVLIYFRYLSPTPKKIKAPAIRTHKPTQTISNPSATPIFSATPAGQLKQINP